MAVGPGHVLVAFLDRFQIRDKCGNILLAARAGDWAGDPAGMYYNPRLLYDPWRSRYLMLWSQFDAPRRIMTAGSRTPDPTGQWVVRYWDTEPVFGTFTLPQDYDLGYSAKALFASGNQLGGNGDAAGLWIFNPAEIYAPGGASAWLYRLTTNSDGTTMDTPRCTHMLANFSGGWDGVFVNSRAGGGSRLYVQRISDPLNVGSGRTRTASFVPVASYSTPPTATQIGGNLSTFDCRATNAMAIPPAAGASSMSLFTSLNTQSAAFPALCAARVLAVDPVAGTVQLDTDVTDGVRHYFRAAASANYQKNAVWWFVRSTASEYAEMRYLGWDDGSLGASVFVGQGDGPPPLLVWGRAQQGCLDWYDYLEYGPLGPQKLWGINQVPGSGNSSRTKIGITTAEGTSAGLMAVNPGTGLSFVGFEGGPFTPPSGQYTVSNAGGVSFAYEVSGIPAWVAATNLSGQVDPARNVVLDPAPAAFQPFGNHSSTLVFKDCYSRATTTRNVNLRVDAWRQATGLTVVYGQAAAGDLRSLRAEDGDVLRVCKFFVPNQLVAPVTVEVTATAPSSPFVRLIRFTVRSRMATSGAFTQQLSMYDFANGGWSAFSAASPIGTTMGTQSTVVPFGGAAFVESGTHRIRARYEVRKAGPSTNAVWCHETDRVYWEMTPN